MAFFDRNLRDRPGALLWERRIIGETTVCGGHAIPFRFDWRGGTPDVVAKRLSRA